MSRPRVLLADDHRVVAEGLRSLLAEAFEVVGVVEDGAAMVAAAKELKPDVIVADISMPGLSGLDALARLKRDDPGVRVVLLTMHTEGAYARRALAAGACGYVVKHSAASELVAALRAALAGKAFVSPAVAGNVSGGRRRPAGGDAGVTVPPASARSSSSWREACPRRRSRTCFPSRRERWSSTRPR